MKIRGSVVSLSFIFPHPPEDNNNKKKSSEMNHLRALRAQPEVHGLVEAARRLGRGQQDVAISLVEFPIGLAARNPESETTPETARDGKRKKESRLVEGQGGCGGV